MWLEIGKISDFYCDRVLYPASGVSLWRYKLLVFYKSLVFKLVLTSGTTDNKLKCAMQVFVFYFWEKKEQMFVWTLRFRNRPKMFTSGKIKFLHLNINDVSLTAVSCQLCLYNLINSLLGDFVNYLWNNYDSFWQWRRGLKKAFSSQFIDKSPGLIILSAEKK